MFLWIEIIVYYHSSAEKWLSKLLTILVYMPDRKYGFKTIKLLRVQMCVYTYEGKNDITEN